MDKEIEKLARLFVESKYPKHGKEMSPNAQELELATIVIKAGYKSPEEMKAFGNQRFQEGLLQVAAVLKAEGYVKLAKDQTYRQVVGEIEDAVHQEHIIASWRKVILPKE